MKKFSKKQENQIKAITQDIGLSVKDAAEALHKLATTGQKLSKNGKSIRKHLKKLLKEK